MNQKSKINILFLVIILLMFLGAMSEKLTFVSLGLTFLTSIVIAFDSIKNKSINTCINIILLLCFQNFCIGTGAHIAGNTSDSLKFITQIPFMTIFVIWFVMQIQIFKTKHKMIKEKKYFFILLIMIAFSIIVGRGSIAAMLMNIRNLTVFFMAYEIGLFYLDTNDKIDNYIIKYNKILLFMLIVGVFLLVGGYNIYSKIGVSEVYMAKQDVGMKNGLNQRFYTTLFSMRIPRMGSLYYEPVNLAYLYSIGLIVNMFYKSNNKLLEKSKLFNIFVSGIGLFLSFGKGGWLIAFCIILYKIINSVLSVNNKGKNKTVRVISTFLMVVGVLGFCIYSYKNINTSANPHFWGVIRTWSSIKQRPYGYGLGTGGNMAYSFNENYIATYDESSAWLSSGGESAIMTFLYQIGIQGVLFLVLCMFSMSDYNNYEENKNDTFISVLKIMPLVLIGVAILQENTFTPQCIVPFMIIQGAFKNVYKGGKQKNEVFDSYADI